MTGRDQKRLAHSCLSTNSPSFRSSFPRCIRRSRGNRGRAGKEGTDAGRWTGYEVSPSGALAARVADGEWGGGLSAPAQSGHHSRPQHPRARGERRRRPAPRGHVMRARGLELQQRAATERSSAGRSRRVLLLLLLCRPRPSCRRCSPLLAAACIPSRGTGRRRRRRCQQGPRCSRPPSFGASLLAAARTSPRHDGAAGLTARQCPERDVHRAQRHRGVLPLDVVHRRYRQGASPILDGCSAGCLRRRRQSPASAPGKARSPAPGALSLLGRPGPRRWGAGAAVVHWLIRCER